MQGVQIPLRVHWCHECPAWQLALVQVALAASAHLESGENNLWFRPDLRLSFAGLDCNMTGDKEAWLRMSGFMRHSDPDFSTWQAGSAVTYVNMVMAYYGYKCGYQGMNCMSMWTVGIERCDIWGGVRWR